MRAKDGLCIAVLVAGLAGCSEDKHDARGIGAAGFAGGLGAGMGATTAGASGMPVTGTLPPAAGTSGLAGRSGGAVAGTGSGGRTGFPSRGGSAGRETAGMAGAAGGTSAMTGGGTTEPPPAVCTSPLMLMDVSKTTTVIGTGTPDSCTEAALRTAISAGGMIAFNCGEMPVTLKITQTLTAPSNKDTTIDGGDKVTLDGGGTTQILRSSGSNFRMNDRVLRVQRLVFAGGKDLGTGFKERDGDKTCAWGYKQGGGGAIFVRDVNLQAIGVTFRDNHGPELGPDVAGGAIYASNSKKLVIANSVFTGNSAANGGAIGLLQTSAELYNVTFEKNQATGLLANFGGATGCPTFNHSEQGGAGGLGGAFYSDGEDPGDTFCGVRMSDNTSGDLGGAVFRSAYWGLNGGNPKQEFSWDQTTLERNTSGKGGGAAYLNNASFTLKRSHFTGNQSKDDGGALKLTGLTLHFDDVDFTNNKAATTGGAVAQWEGGPDGAGTATNVRFSGNKPGDTAGDYPK